MERILGNSSTVNAATWGPESLQRGTFSILSTCIITLSLCVWTAIHLNIPEHGRPWQQIWRKCGWMILGFLAPELVAYAAYQQFAIAKKLTNAMKRLLSWRRADVENQASTAEDGHSEGYGREWTFVHSYFARMGGFTLGNNMYLSQNGNIFLPLPSRPSLEN